MAGLAIYRQIVIYRQIKVVGMSANKTIQRIPNSPPTLDTYPPACIPSRLETGSRADPAYWETSEFLQRRIYDLDIGNGSD